MKLRTGRMIVWGGLLGLILAAMPHGWQVYGQDVTKPQAAPRAWESPTSALTTLQKIEAQEGNVFAVQGELDSLIAKDGGGACATAAGIDLLQAVRYMAGYDRHPNPYRLTFAAMSAQPELLQGRVTNAGLVKLIKNGQAAVGSITLDVDVQSAPNSVHAVDKRYWPEVEGPNVTVAPRQLKILSYTVTEANGHVLGRHFVLLKNFIKNEVTVLDPSSPTKDRRYILEYRAKTKDDPARIFLLNPAGTITGAYFIREFVGDTPWAHLDIAGTAWNDSSKPYLSVGPTGVCVRTLVNLVNQMASQ